MTCWPDGFENVGVSYTRQVIYVKDEFWIVKDDFKSAYTNDYMQVWQGHYSSENAPSFLKATVPVGIGHDILQVNKTDSVVGNGKRGKEWSVVSKSKQQDYSFLTVIFPFRFRQKVR